MSLQNPLASSLPDEVLVASCVSSPPSKTFELEWDILRQCCSALTIILRLFLLARTVDSMSQVVSDSSSCEPINFGLLSLLLPVVWTMSTSANCPGNALQIRMLVSLICYELSLRTDGRSPRYRNLFAVHLTMKGWYRISECSIRLLAL